MLKYLLILVPFLINNVYAQPSAKEFEGVITYKTTITPLVDNIDVEQLYNAFGRGREYYFRQGKFKWQPSNVKLEYEIWNPDNSSNCLIDKFHANDTLYYTEVDQIKDTVIDIRALETKRILGIDCKGFAFSVQTKADASIFKRIIYYALDSLPVKPYCLNFKAMGQNVVANHKLAIPLRLELISDDIPFTIIYEATNIQWKSLSDKEFAIDVNLPATKKQ